MTDKERPCPKITKKEAQKIKDQMTFEQKIAFVNTPYGCLPDNLKIGMTKRPQKFNFVKMKHPKIGDQKETFAARLIRYRKKYHLSVEDFALIANEFAKMYGARVTKLDIINYENYNVCPKIDKMTAIAEAMGLSLDYFAGYGSDDRQSRNDILESRAFGNVKLSISYQRELKKRKGVSPDVLGDWPTDPANRPSA